MAAKPTQTKQGSRREQDGRPKTILDPRLVKALGHPIRNEALAILNERVASPNEIAKELGEPVGHVSYHVNVLKDCECIELVSTAQRRGAVEHYYRATARAFLDDAEWEMLPRTVRAGLSASLVQTVAHDTGEALASGSFDARTDRHFSWTPMLLDEAGWGEIVAEMAGTLDRVLEIQAAAAARLAEADEEGIPVSVAMIAYEAASTQKQRVVPRDS